MIARSKIPILLNCAIHDCEFGICFIAETLNDSMKQISIIGKDNSTETKTIKKPLETNLDDLDLLPPPPPNGKRKVIVAQRPNSFIWNLKVQFTATLK